ncbi:MAG: glycoside hydrolase [Candidatus Omnitrophota bacterium]|jgi:alpha-mannosidase|nr:MAG: glycoside hydrolase [Candidatus Omnitrophota bacterium]
MKKLCFLLILCLPLFAHAQPKRIYIACDDHTDMLWSADEKTYHDAFVRMQDYYLDLAEKTKDNPPDFQSRFVCDGSYWLWVYEQYKSEDEFAHLIGQIKSGHISAPMNTLCCCYGGLPTEAILRSLYYAGSLERRYGIRFRMAQSMENQTLPWGLASLFAGAGAKYSWKGICQCASRIPDAANREHEIYDWTGPDGQKILVKWNSMLKNNQSMGGYAEARDPWGIVNYVSFDPEFQKRYPFPIIGCFGKGWDDLETRNDEFVFAAQHLSDDNHRVIVSNMLDFFEDFEQHYGKTLPAVDYSYGNEWELLWASMAEVSASVKRSVETLRAAEALAAIISLHDPTFMNGREEQRERCFINLGLYVEHSWTGDGPVPREDRAAWQRKIADGIHSYVNTLYNDGMRRFGEMIANPEAKERFFVFNPLSWSRTDYADFSFSSPKFVHVVDVDNGKEVPSQLITANKQTHLRILAKDIPPIGYKIYEIRNGKGKEFKDTITIQNHRIENDVYRIELSPSGAITSLIDKRQANREYARQVNDRWINDIGSATGALQIEHAGPVSASIKALSSAPLQRVSSITLFRDSDRIDIKNEIIQNFSDVYTYGFAFNLDSPVVHHEEVGAIAKARLTTDGGQYATRSARYDWLTLNHFADMTGERNAGVTLSNADSFYFKLGNSKVKLLDGNTPIMYALIGGQIDGRNLGIHDQGGDQHFLHRFALRTHTKYDPVSAMKFSLEHQNPLLCGKVTGNKPRLSQTKYSLISVSNPNLLLWAIKPAEEGIHTGMITRLWNVSDANQTSEIQLNAFPIKSAYAVTHLETDEEKQPVHAAGLSANFEKQQIRTFRLTVAESH